MLTIRYSPRLLKVTTCLYFLVDYWTAVDGYSSTGVFHNLVIGRVSVNFSVRTFAARIWPSLPRTPPPFSPFSTDLGTVEGSVPDSGHLISIAFRWYTTCIIIQAITQWGDWLRVKTRLDLAEQYLHLFACRSEVSDYAFQMMLHQLHAYSLYTTEVWCTGWIKSTVHARSTAFILHFLRGIRRAELLCEFSVCTDEICLIVAEYAGRDSMSCIKLV